MRGLAVGVEFVHALIAGIGQQFDVRCQRQARTFEEGKIMRFAPRHLHTQNLFAGVSDHKLSFLGVALFLAGVEPLLFFGALDALLAGIHHDDFQVQRAVMQRLFPGR